MDRGGIVQSPLTEPAHLARTCAMNRNTVDVAGPNASGTASAAASFSRHERLPNSALKLTKHRH